MSHLQYSLDYMHAKGEPMCARLIVVVVGTASERWTSQPRVRGSLCTVIVS
jgi:hypothetical protein